MITTTTRTLYTIRKRKSDRSPLVWPVLVLLAALVDGLGIWAVVLYCRAKGWL